MSKLTVFASFVLLILSVDLLPLNDVTKQFHHLVKRSENSSQISPPGNSSTSCNSTAGGCNNSTLMNSTNNENLTNSFNATKIHLNLTEVCQPNGTALKAMCNGTLLNLTEHCNNVTVDNISLYCINGSIVSNVTIQPASNNVSLGMQNATLNSSTANNTNVNTTVAVNITVSISPSKTTGASMSLTPTPSLSSITASSSSQVSAVTEASSSSVHPSSSSVMLASSSVGGTNAPNTGTTSHGATPQPATTQPTTPQTTTSTTPQSTSTQLTTTTKEPPTSQTTKLPSTPHKEGKTTPSEKTTTTVETEVVNHKTTETKTEKTNAVTTMQSPYDSAKNIKFFYVNVLIPVGIGVCGALLIAFSVILFKCCRRKKLKKVRYFGKPRGGYTRNNMDHMNLLAHSSDEE